MKSFPSAFLSSLFGFVSAISANAELNLVADYDFTNNSTPPGLTEFGNPTYSEGKLMLDGSGDYLQISSPLTAATSDNFVLEVIANATGTGPFNFAASITPATGNGGYGLLAQGGNWGALTSGIAFAGNSPHGATPTGMVALAYVRENGNVSLYVNGNKFDNGSGDGFSLSNPSVLSIGAHAFDAANNNGFFIGEIDRVRISTIDSTFDVADLLGPDDGTAGPPPAPVLRALPVNLDAGQNTTLQWDLPDGVTSATLQTSTGNLISNITTDTGSVTSVPSGIATYHLIYGSHTAVATAFSGQALTITEFMAANSDTLDDEDGNSSDWIELYNASTTPIDTAGWRLSDDESNTGWSLPSRILAPGEFLIVFASSKNRAPTAGEIHTDFSLSSSGEDLVLRNPAGQITSSYTNYGRQFSDFSLGLPMNGITENPAQPASFRRPTPGAENNAGSAPGPVIENVTQNIPPQVAGIPLVITAEVSSPTARISNVTLHHRRMFNNEQSLAMLDNGTNGDAFAGDGIYSATIPGSQIVAGEMVRWSVTATEDTGGSGRSPRFDSPTSSAEYFGTIGADPAINTQIPLIHWFTADPAAATTAGGTRSSVFHENEFYDNVFTRRRGQFGSTLVPKKSIKIDFNNEHEFQYHPDQRRVDEINLNTTDPDKAYIRRILAWDLYEATGVPGSQAFMVRLHQNGSFWGVSTFVEQPDRDFLRREDLLDEDGALYKMFNAATSATSGVEKKTRRDENNTDLQVLISALNSGSSTSRDQYLWDHVDIPSAINFMAASRIMHENDDQSKNYYLHRNTTTTGEWTFVPWDKDLTWGRNYTREGESIGSIFLNIYNDTIWADNDTTAPFPGPSSAAPSHPLFGNRNHTKNDPSGPYCRLSDALLTNSTIRQMYLRRLRTQMDEFLQSSSTPLANRFLENRIEELYTLLESDVADDRTIWANPVSPYGATQDFRQAIDVITENYLPRRRTHLFVTHTGDSSTRIPNAPQVSTPDITFGSLDFNPASGNQDHEYLELINNAAEFIDLSNWTITGGIRHTLKPGTVIPPGESLYLTPNAIAFRQRTTSPTGDEQRYAQGNYSGNLSNFGESLTLSTPDANLIDTLTYAGDPTDNQLSLVISEIMYAPANPDAEYLELTNISPTLTLNLEDVSFTDGIEFQFPAGSTLAPGARVLLVYDLAAFESSHGPGLPIAGTFTSGRLSNGGEKIKLDDADGSTIREFTYDNRLPWTTPPAGSNFSLVLVNPHTNPDHKLPANWRASLAPGGTPGNPSNTSSFTGHPSDDLDHDGLPALLEYALGSSDSTPDSSPLTFSNGTLSFPRNLAAEDISVTVETSSDLSTWHANAVLSEQTHNNDGTLSESWHLPQGPKIFARLKVSLNR